MLHVERLPAVEVDGVEGAAAAGIEAGDEHDAFAGVGLEDAAGEGFHFVGRAYAGLHRFLKEHCPKCSEKIDDIADRIAAEIETTQK